MTPRDLKAGDLVTLPNLDMGRVLENNDGVCQVLVYGERFQVPCYDLTLIG